MTWTLALLFACAPDAPTPPPASAPVEAPAPAPAPPPELPDPTDPRLAATHLLVAWDGAATSPKGAATSPKGPGRDREEARRRADSLLARATPDNLEELAREASDDPSAPRGGRLGVWATGVMDRDFERCVGAIEVGAIGPLCETAHGFHVLRRDPVVEASGSLLVARFPPDDLAASQAARDRLDAAIARLVTEDPGPVAAELELELVRVGPTGRGQLLPAVDQALFALDPGQTSEAIDTPGAWIAVWRAP